MRLIIFFLLFLFFASAKAQQDSATTSLDPKKKKRLGGVPFRVWQMYDAMVDSLKRGKIDEFICAGGCMSHYVGDACQPLDMSYKYDEIIIPEDKGIHNVCAGRQAIRQFKSISIISSAYANSKYS